MKLRFALLLPSAAAALLLSSCATKFTAAQRAQLSTVAVTKTSVVEGAYEEPYGGDVAARNAATQAAGGGLIALAVTSSISGTQNNMSRSENGHYFAAVEKNTPGNLSSLLQSKLAVSLKNNAFFKNRVQNTSENTVTSEITCYRLVRTGKNDGVLLFSPEVYVDIYLKDRSGKKLAGRSYVSTNPSAAPIAQYASSAEKTRKGYEEALEGAVSQFSAELAIKTGE